MSEAFTPVFNGKAIRLDPEMTMENVQAVIDLIGPELNPKWGVNYSDELYVGWDEDGGRSIRMIYCGDYITKNADGEIRAWYRGDFEDFFGTQPE